MQLLKLAAPLMAALLSTGAMRGVEIIAHRGASFDAPENTVASLRLGYEQGADAGELDIHLSKDGRIVVIHDADTGRATGRKQAVADQTVDELRTLENGQWGKWKGSAFVEKIPQLTDILAIVPAGKRLFIETKVKAEIVPELERVIRAAGVAPQQLPLITFDLETARILKVRLPAHEVSWIVDHPATGAPSIDDLIRAAKAAGLDGLDLSYKFPMDAAFVKKVHAAGLKLYTWTVDDPAVARALAAAGIDGITTNRPGWLRAQLAKP
jgi:glycerophosphoryl diester phosphodiesterase